MKRTARVKKLINDLCNTVGHDYSQHDICTRCTRCGADLIPAGTILPSTGPIPKGWLECNGASISKKAYAKLFQAIGEAHGSTSTHFNLPDLRGRQVAGSTGTALVSPNYLIKTI